MRLLVFALAGLAACDGAEREARQQQAIRSEIARAETAATATAAVPSTGLWTEAHLLERLVRAGVAPPAVADAPTGPEWMHKRPVAFLAGGGTVLAWIYRDSLERRAVTDSLDHATMAPPGRAIPFNEPIIFVVQNNLAAVIVGGSETNQDRISLALQGGLPVTTAAPKPGTLRP